MRHIRSHLTFANLVAVVALFLALGGTAIAAVIVSSNSQVAQNTISGHHPPAGDHPNIIGASLNATDLASGAVTGGKVASNSINSSKVSLTGADVANDSLSGQNIKESSLGQVPSARTAAGLGSSLARGQTLRGNWDVRFIDPLPNGTINPGSSAISFGFRFAQAPVAHVVQGSPVAGCPGSIASPEAAAGNLCVYVGQANVLHSLTVQDVHSFGATVVADTSTQNSTLIASGTWAATAP